MGPPHDIRFATAFTSQARTATEGLRTTVCVTTDAVPLAENDPSDEGKWRPQRDSNPCRGLESKDEDASGAVNPHSSRFVPVEKQATNMRLFSAFNSLEPLSDLDLRLTGAHPLLSGQAVRPQLSRALHGSSAISSVKDTDERGHAIPPALGSRSTARHRFPTVCPTPFLLLCLRVQNETGQHPTE